MNRILPITLGLFITGCATTKIEPPNPTQSHNTETYWKSGSKPKSIVINANTTASIITFNDAKNGKEAGFTKMAVFGAIKPGRYGFEQVTQDSIIFINAEGKVTISSTNPNATIYVPQDGFVIFRGFAEKKTELVIDSGEPAPPAPPAPVQTQLTTQPIPRAQTVNQHRIGDLSTLPEPNLSTLDRRLDEDSSVAQLMEQESSRASNSAQRAPRPFTQE